jgi:hypothetical protein
MTLPGTETVTDVAVRQVRPSSICRFVPLVESQSIGDRILERVAVTWVSLYSTFHTCEDAQPYAEAVHVH